MYFDTDSSTYDNNFPDRFAHVSELIRTNFVCVVAELVNENEQRLNGSPSEY